MSLGRREFLQTLAAGAASGLALDHPAALAAGPGAADRLYDLPPFGTLGLLHYTDCHAQLRPLEFREPSVNLGVGTAAGQPPHLVGEAFLKRFSIPPGSAEAHAFTCLDYTQAARAYGRVGGFAHLATLIKRLRASRPHSLLLDGGDTWQGSATALWTHGADMIEAQRLLGVDAMSSHWEHTYGADRVRRAVDGPLKDAGIAFLAQNVRGADFGDPVFEPALVRSLNGVPVAVIGQAFPYTPIANPRHFVPDWTFGIQEATLQATIDAVRAGGAKVVVLLSHNGMDVDLKLAGRMRGLDAILGGHTHDGMPAPTLVPTPDGKRTIVTNAGSNGKFLGVLDLDVGTAGVRDFRYRLLPVYANLLPADPAMQAHIAEVRAPFADRLGEVLATNDTLLYRRGNFNGPWDQLIVDALQDVKDAEIAFSPGFRWGTTLLPGEPITRERLMDQLAITYPATTLVEMTGAMLKTVLEDVADNLYNPNPYLQQGGDMVRVGGLDYRCTPGARIGARIDDLRLADGRAIEADKRYKVAGWASVAPDARGEPIWDVVETWLRARRHAPAAPPHMPKLIGVDGDPGLLPGPAG